MNFLENKFTGQEVLETKIKDPVSGEEETIKLNYFKSIPTQSKIYNKVLISGKTKPLNFKKAL